LFMNWQPAAMRMINTRDAAPYAFQALAGEASLSRYLPFLSSRAGSTRPPWVPPATEAPVAAVWVVALLALLVLDRLARSRDRVDRWFRGLALPLLLFLAVSVAIDYGVRPGGPPGVAPHRTAVPAGGPGSGPDPTAS
jgi:hypothetical protein